MSFLRSAVTRTRSVGEDQLALTHMRIKRQIHPAVCASICGGSRRAGREQQPNRHQHSDSRTPEHI
jgi:hypothetical protein